MICGYARVSTIQQDFSIQIKSLIHYGVDERYIFKEKISGVSTRRPELKKLIDYLRKDDILVVYKLDRLGRSLTNLINILNDLNKKGIIFISLTENIDLSTSSGKLQFHMLASLAEYNRELIRERTIEGLKIAKASGKILGRKSLLNKEQKKYIETLLDEGKSKYEIVKILGLKSRSPIYTYLNDKENKEFEMLRKLDMDKKQMEELRKKFKAPNNEKLVNLISNQPNI